MWNGVWNLTLSAALGVGQVSLPVPPETAQPTAAPAAAPTELPALPQVPAAATEPIPAAATVPTAEHAATEAVPATSAATTPAANQTYQQQAIQPSGNAQQSGFRPYCYRHTVPAAAAPVQSESGWWDQQQPLVVPRVLKQEDMKSYLERVEAASYAAEMARLRAQRDFGEMQRTAFPQQAPSASPSPEKRIDLTTYARPTVATPGVDMTHTPGPVQANHTTTTTLESQEQAVHRQRLEALKKQLEQQTARLQALQKSAETKPTAKIVYPLPGKNDTIQ